MPFKSKQQMRYLFSQKPEVAKEFESAQKAEGKSFKSLPEYSGKKRFSKLSSYLKKNTKGNK